MADFPIAALPLFINTWSLKYSAFKEIVGASGVLIPASGTWPVANTAFYIPFWIPWNYPVRRVFWANGTSVASTNMDFGVYSADGRAIYTTGSTAASGASSLQYVTPTEFTLGPGRYYFALSDSSTTANRGGQASTVPTVARMEMAGVLQEASALPLPATMTPVAVANVYWPLCGITRTPSGF